MCEEDPCVARMTARKKAMGTSNGEARQIIPVGKGRVSGVSGNEGNQDLLWRPPPPPGLSRATQFPQAICHSFLPILP